LVVTAVSVSVPLLLHTFSEVCVFTSSTSFSSAAVATATAAVGLFLADAINGGMPTMTTVFLLFTSRSLLY
jgi:uncharacterized membrane protein